MKAWLVVPLLSVGCAYRVALSTTPSPAEVVLPDGRVVATPTVQTLRWVPYGHQRIVVHALGHRDLEVDLRKTEIRFWHFLGRGLFRSASRSGGPRGESRIVLVPEHGPSGTWTEVDVP